MNSAEDRRPSPIQPQTRNSISLGFLQIPAAAWIRAVALVGILAVIKCGLILQLAPHLFQTHWRVGGYELTRRGQIEFLFLVLLVVSHLLLLTRDCRIAGAKALRIANGGILAIGLLFILLTFHSGQNNLLFPILAGILKWSSLGPYLSLDFFFQQPFLAAWIFVYALIYYGLARTKRERWSLYLTTIFAAIYACWNLRELALYQDELLAVDAIGLVSLVFALRRGNGLPLKAQVIPLAWTSCFAGLLIYSFGAAAPGSAHYFAGLVTGSALLFAVLTWWLKKQRAISVWSRQGVFFFAAFVLLANTHYPVAQNYNQALWLGLEFPRYFVGEALIGLGLLGLAAINRWWLPKIGSLWLDVISLLLIALALVDLRITALLGVRFDWSVLALGNTPTMMWRMAKPYLPLVLLSLAALAAVYILTVRLLDRWLNRQVAAGSFGLKGRGWGYAAAVFAALALCGLHSAFPDKARGQAGIRLAATSPWWKRISGHTPSPEKFFETAKSLGVTFDATASYPKSLPPRELNVVLVFMESTYNQHLSLFGADEETQPLLGRYKDRMELFPNFFSCFASSIHARFAAFTSLYPVQEYNTFTVERVPVKSIFDVLHDQGYDCSMFYSSFADFTGFRDFLKGRGVGLYDADNMPGQRTTPRVSWGLREEETLGAMRSEIQKHAADGRKFFLTYVPAAPHYPYEGVPVRFRKFKMTEPGDYKAPYLNELLYMDWVLASLVDQLRDSGLLEKTLVVITDDHGEMLGGKEGPIGHGWWLTPQLVNAPLIILDPEKPGYHVNPTVGSQVDLLPTLCDRLRIPFPADQLYQGRSLDAAGDGPHRLIYLNSFQQYAVLEGNRMLFGDREKEHGSTGFGTAYAITNEGTKTIFTCETGAAALPISIRRFDEFQQALLKNYSTYSRAAAQTRGRSEAWSATP